MSPQPHKALGAPSPPGAPQGGPSPLRQPWDRGVREESISGCCQGTQAGRAPTGVTLPVLGEGRAAAQYPSWEETNVQYSCGPSFRISPVPLRTHSPVGAHRAVTPSNSSHPPPPPAGAVSSSATPQPALTALGVKPPGWHTSGHHSSGVGGQGDRQVDGAGQRHLGPVPGEQVDTDSRHRRQLQPGAIGCGDKDGDSPKGGPHGVYPPLPKSPVSPVPLPSCSAPRKAGKARARLGPEAAVRDAASWL